jgi:glyoxylase-like metal-dependent hydrolase (beta-lactamase superfamily II)
MGSSVSSDPLVTGFYDKRTGSIQYVAADPSTRRCVVIDPVLDFDEKSGATATWSADVLLDYVHQNGFEVDWIIDTHPHADHFSAAGYMKVRTGAPTATGSEVVRIQKLWKSIYNLDESFATDGSQWDRLFTEGDRFKLGDMTAEIMFSPGHTMASVSILIGNSAFIHDTLFMPDSGTARADFPGGDATQLWRSICQILALPDNTRLFTGHDYQPGGREPLWESTVGEQKASNAHVNGQDEASFVRIRAERDSQLPMPKLILQSLQINIAGGRLPEPEENGIRYLKIPLNVFGDIPWS